MPRVAGKLTQGDITRALKAARSAGFEVDTIEIRPDGVMQISRLPTAVARPADAFDAWKARRDAR